ncbi:MAG TPA: aminotransferase class IV [Solirubrobacteraceae bacterium]|nr:aminotransferase class IV [Solirubrobacteraceae bacterium]
MRVQPVRQALDYGPRPQAGRGIFETIRLEPGRTPRFEAQLERLRRSAAELYGAAVEAALAPQLAAIHALSLPPSGRLRVRLVPDRAPQADIGPRPPDPVYTELAPFVLPGGLGAHKWLDRRLVDALAAAAGAGGLPVLIDADGAVLESVRMNVLIEERGRLVSPPADGRFRPGFGREALRYAEEPVDLDRLLAADAVVLTSALRRLRIPLSG